MSLIGMVLAVMALLAGPPGAAPAGAEASGGSREGRMTRHGAIVALEAAALRAHAERRWPDSVRDHSRAIDLARTLPDRPRLVAVLFNRLGRVLEDEGRIQNAVVAYESGLKALAADPRLDIGGVLDALGSVRKEFGGSPDAAVPDLYSESGAGDLESAEADPLLAVRLLINAGNAYLGQPQDRPALNAYDQALKRPEIARAPELRGRALANRGVILRRRGDVLGAEDALTEALALLDAHGVPEDKRQALSALAGLLRDRGDLDRAIPTYAQALALYAQAGDPRGEGRTRAGLGHLYLGAGRYPEARTEYELAIALGERTADQETLWQAHWGLGRCLLVGGDLDRAAAALARSLELIDERRRELRTDEGKVTFLQSVQDVYDQLITVHLARARTDARAYADALSVSEAARARALRDLMGGRERRRPAVARVDSPGTRPPQPAARRENPAAQMAAGVLTGELGRDLVPPESGPEGATSLENRALSASRLARDLEPATPSLLGDIQRARAARSSSPMPDPASPPREMEPPSSSIGAQRAGAQSAGVSPPPASPGGPPRLAPPPLPRLVFHVLHDRTVVFAVGPDGLVRAHVATIGREALTERIADIRRALDVDGFVRGSRLDAEALLPPPLDPGALLRALHAELIMPVADALPGDGTAIVIEPHGPLWLLPFGALVEPDGRWLADRWPMLLAPSIRVLEEIRREPPYGRPGDSRILAMGNPIMPRSETFVLQPLPGAEAEARAIVELFPDTQRQLLVGAAADPDTVRTLAPMHTILHLATHGLADPADPLRSFVALTPSEGRSGLLTARDVLDLSLPLDLVTLSACQTGLGRITGDGMIGLSRAFLVAGARSVVVSQWSVDDRATTRLMVEFYRAYLEGGDKPRALQRAMQKLRADQQYAEPRYWAPFVVVGAEE